VQLVVVVKKLLIELRQFVGASSIVISGIVIFMLNILSLPYKLILLLYTKRYKIQNSAASLI